MKYAGQSATVPAHLGVRHCEANRHGQVDPCLQEGNDLSAGAWGSDHQHVLQNTGATECSLTGHVMQRNDGSKYTARICAFGCSRQHRSSEADPFRSVGVGVQRPYLSVAQDGVVEQDAEEHCTQRQNLLPGEHIVSQHLLALRGGIACCGLHWLNQHWLLAWLLENGLLQGHKASWLDLQGFPDQNYVWCAPSHSTR